MQITIEYSVIETENYFNLSRDVERTQRDIVEVYTLPIVACARIEALSAVGIKCRVKTNLPSIIIGS